ncbi:hypothetical protein [Priestia koreensis]|uniref:hypothetical protein n=1 Tax=Priestia koreensis TaxID=284581 RepID=UPI00203B647E|nr:hypothetical protein [Priestia koreensis]MCM3005645.1 hypothetical protein [Priestia koreensis]
MLMYYVLLMVGFLSLIVTIIRFIAMHRNKGYTLLNVGKTLIALVIGVFCLVMTLPSLKYIVLKEYDTVSGKCVIDIDSAGRSSEADFAMTDTDEDFIFRNISNLDASGKSIPYYCQVTVTKDHQFEISYKIYDAKTRKLVSSGK